MKELYKVHPPPDLVLQFNKTHWNETKLKRQNPLTVSDTPYICCLCCAVMANGNTKRNNLDVILFSRPVPNWHLACEVLHHVLQMFDHLAPQRGLQIVRAFCWKVWKRPLAAGLACLHAPCHTHVPPHTAQKEVNQHTKLIKHLI